MVIFLSQIIHYIVSFTFGAVLTVCFSGMECNRRNISRLIGLTLAIFSVTLLVYVNTDAMTVAKLYPFLVHFPLALFLLLHCKIRLYVSLSSIVIGYLFCQMPSWFSRFLSIPFRESVLLEAILYGLLCSLFAAFLIRYALEPIRNVLQMPRYSLLTYCIVPILYYLFDYFSTVYTDLLYSGNWYIAQFMPTMISCGYLLFIIFYHNEMVRKVQLQSERDLLDAQFQRSKVELSVLQSANLAASTYRHDLRHHLIALKTYATEGNLDQVISYINQLNSDIETSVPKRYSNNDTVNLLYTYYASQAKQHHVDFRIQVRLPDELPIRDTQLCSMLSNALENAFRAVEDLPEEQRYIESKFHFHRGNLLLSVENPYCHEITIKDGLPYSSQPGHGYGVRSISTLVKENGGQLLCSAENGLFRLQVMIPPAKYPTK